MNAATRPLQIAPQAVPSVCAMLVGPEALHQVVFSGDQGAFQLAPVQTSIAAAATVFRNSAYTALHFPQVDNAVAGLQTGAPSYDTAVQSLTRALSTLPSGHYALGRRALQRALVAKRGVLTLDASRLSHRKLAVAVGLTNDEHRQRCWTDSEHHMATFGDFGRPETFEAEARLGLLASFSVTGSLPDCLEPIWSNPAASSARRLTALDLWHHYFQESLGPSGAGAGVVAATAPFANAAARLFDLALDEPDAQVRKRALSVLGAWLQVDGNFSALVYLTKIRQFLDTDGHLADREMSLIRLYSGILAAHGPTLKGPGHLHDAIVEGALALLDIARDARLTQATRTYAFGAALYAVEKFVPSGAQIMYDWTRWQVETTADPTMARQYAFDYMQIFTAKCWDDCIPVNAQQREVGLLALHKRDLSAEHRKHLWDLMDVNQRFWTITRNSWARHFGAAADPKPVRSARAA